MYNGNIWQDSVRDPARTYNQTKNADGTVTMTPAGKVIQQGTNQSATNFNVMENGIRDSHIAAGIIFQHMLQIESDHSERIYGLEVENKVEVGTVTLTNSAKYPFNNSIKTVSLDKARDTSNYLVECSVVNYSGGLPGEIKVSEKALNGFKLDFDGSATSVTIRYIIKGGILS